MQKALRTLKTRVGCVGREATRQLDPVAQQVRDRAKDLLARTGRILTQQTQDKQKLCALNTPEMECIS